jgi:hypothetical protein
MARCAAVLLNPTRPPVGIEVLTRSSLEAASVAWWLLEAGITARQRVCRLQLLRRNNARELERDIAEIGASPTIAVDTVLSVEHDCHSLGLAPFERNGDKLESELRLRYTDRVKSLIDEWGYQGGYNIYSGVAHAELSGLWRLFQHVASMVHDHEPVHNIGPNREATHAAVRGLLLSMVAPMHQIVLHFGWKAPGKSEEVGAMIDHVNDVMARLKP